MWPVKLHESLFNRYLSEIPAHPTKKKTEITFLDGFKVYGDNISFEEIITRTFSRDFLDAVTPIKVSKMFNFVIINLYSKNGTKSKVLSLKNFFFK